MQMTAGRLGCVCAMVGMLVLGCTDDPIDPVGGDAGNGAATDDMDAAATPDGDIEGSDDDGSVDDAAADDAAAGAMPKAQVRGRVTDDKGMPLVGVPVVVGDQEVQTDDKGGFSAVTGDIKGGEVRVAVRSDKYSSAVMPVSAGDDAASVEVAVVEKKTLMVAEAMTGGRVEDDSGFAVNLAEASLRKKNGEVVAGPVEIRFAVVDEPEKVTAAPGRMQREDKTGLEGSGIVEVTFFQDGEELTLAEPADIEIPLVDDHGLQDGDEVEMFALGKDDSRWKPAPRAMAQGNKVVVRTDKTDWLGAASPLPDTSCVSGSLTFKQRPAPATAVRAARKRGLSLIQAQTLPDGSFCLAVTPDDDWAVSAFIDDGEQAGGFAVDLDSRDAVGMCGGSGCKDVGEVAIPEF